MDDDPTKLKPLEIDAKILQLNKDLAPLAEQIATLVQRFNEETHGHAADISIRCDWEPIRNYALPFGRYLPVRVQLGAKHIQLPGPAR